MYYPEELASLAIAVVLGLLFVARPETVYHYVFYLYAGADTGRGGRWGEDASLGDRGRLIVRAIGGLLLLVALALALSPWWRDAVF